MAVRIPDHHFSTSNYFLGNELTRYTKIQSLFSQVPATYEAVNHVLTLGFDILWRKKAVKAAVREGGSRWLDVCTGTGETAVYLGRKASKSKHNKATTVFATDFSAPMMQKLKLKSDGQLILCSISDVKNLPFPDACFDLVIISFATRNINLNESILIQTFSEFFRVLSPGGRFVNLETSQPDSPLIRRLFHLYIRALVIPVGSRISGSRPAYAYLTSTIPRFYPAEKLSDIIKQAGFRPVEIKKLLLGMAAIHIAEKPKS
jgi:demethylmenaquinone methyltransferase/2-methoxy-6-polyprenyl-1,4-benzoquinol methylase